MKSSAEIQEFILSLTDSQGQLDVPDYSELLKKGVFTDDELPLLARGLIEENLTPKDKIQSQTALPHSFIRAIQLLEKQYRENGRIQSKEIKSILTENDVLENGDEILSILKDRSVSIPLDSLDFDAEVKVRGRSPVTKESAADFVIPNVPIFEGEEPESSSGEADGVNIENGDGISTLDELGEISLPVGDEEVLDSLLALFPQERLDSGDLTLQEAVKKLEEEGLEEYTPLMVAYFSKDVSGVEPSLLTENIAERAGSFDDILDDLLQGEGLDPDIIKDKFTRQNQLEQLPAFFDYLAEQGMIIDEMPVDAFAEVSDALSHELSNDSLSAQEDPQGLYHQLLEEVILMDDLNFEAIEQFMQEREVIEHLDDFLGFLKNMGIEIPRPDTVESPQKNSGEHGDESKAFDLEAFKDKLIKLNREQGCLYLSNLDEITEDPELMDYTEDIFPFLEEQGIELLQPLQKEEIALEEDPQFIEYLGKAQKKGYLLTEELAPLSVGEQPMKILRQLKKKLELFKIPILDTPPDPSESVLEGDELFFPEPAITQPLEDASSQISQSLSKKDDFDLEKYFAQIKSEFTRYGNVSPSTLWVVEKNEDRKQYIPKVRQYLNGLQNEVAANKSQEIPATSAQDDSSSEQLQETQPLNDDNQSEQTSDLPISDNAEGGDLTGENLSGVGSIEELPALPVTEKYGEDSQTTEEDSGMPVINIEIQPDKQGENQPVELPESSSDSSDHIEEEQFEGQHYSEEEIARLLKEELNQSDPVQAPESLEPDFTRFEVDSPEDVPVHEDSPEKEQPKIDEVEPSELASPIESPHPAVSEPDVAEQKTEIPEVEAKVKAKEEEEAADKKTTGLLAKIPVPVIKVLQAVKKQLRTLILMSLALAALAGVYFWYSNASIRFIRYDTINRIWNIKTLKTEKKRSYFFEIDPVEMKYFSQGDRLVVTNGEKNYNATITQLDETNPAKSYVFVQPEKTAKPISGSLTLSKKLKNIPVYRIKPPYLHYSGPEKTVLLKTDDGSFFKPKLLKNQGKKGEVEAYFIDDSVVGRLVESNQSP